MTQSSTGEEGIGARRPTSPSSERETERNQDDTVESRAGGPEGIESDDVKVLPGTGGPDDTGDIEMDPDEYHPNGDATPQR